MGYWTSTSFGQIFRQAAALAKHVPIPRTAGAAALTGRRARLALKQLARETFPSLTQSTREGIVGSARSHALEPVRIGGRHYRPMSSHARMHASARNARAGWTLPAALRGPRATTNLGLGSARTFASGPSAASMPANVPVVLRAFAALLSDEEVEKSLPRATRFIPYSPRNKQRRHRRSTSTRRLSTTSYSSIDSRFAELSHYLPLRRRAAADIALPCTAETLVTPGATTVLSLPLSPSLSALLSGNPGVPYIAAEVGVAVFSSLTLGMMSLQEAFSMHYWHRIGPILARLDDLGFFGGSLASGMRHELVLDAHGQPDSLRLTFIDRSETDVRALLRSYLVEEAGGQWWSLVQVGKAAEAMQLSKNERKEIMESWEPTDRQPLPQPAPEAHPLASADSRILFEADDFDAAPFRPQSPVHAIDLVFPTLDTSVADRPATSIYSPSIADAADTGSWDTPISPGSSSVYTPISDLDLNPDALSDFSTSRGEYEYGYGMSSSSALAQLSLTASLLSQLSALSPTASHDNNRWAVHPSSSDSDVESAVMLDSGVWDDAVDMDQVEPEVEYDDESGGWAGTGAGFGLAQPW